MYFWIVGIRRNKLAGFSDRDGPTLQLRAQGTVSRGFGRGGRGISCLLVVRVAGSSTPIAGLLRFGVSDQNLVAGSKQKRVRRAGIAIIGDLGKALRPATFTRALRRRRTLGAFRKRAGLLGRCRRQSRIVLSCFVQIGEGFPGLVQ